MHCSADGFSTGSTQMSDASVNPQICRFFRDGKCREGDHCKFSHDLDSASKRNENESALDPNTGTQPAESASKPAPKTKQRTQVLCKFYAKGYCSGGSKCTFLHERPAKKSGRGDRSKQNENNVNSRRELQHEEDSQKRSAHSLEGKRSARVCNFYKSGNCRKGDACQFRHLGHLKKDDDEAKSTSEDGEVTKPESPSIKVSDDKASSVETTQELDKTPDDKEPAATEQDDVSPDSSSSERVPYQRPIIEAKTSMKMIEVTDVGIKQMRATEIKQLKIRFPEAKLEGRERLETYKITVNPTDPDWPYDLQDFELLISFPENYPLVPFLVDMPEEQHLPETVIDYMVPQIQEWVSAKHATNAIAGKVELIFRPFLRWLDKKLETLFTDAARKYKKKVDAKAAGFEFVTFKLKNNPEEKKFDVPNEPSPDKETTDETLGDTTPGSTPDSQDDESLTITTTLAKSSNFESTDTNRRGTEVLFRGMQLSDGVGTLVCTRLSISIQCTRCKNRCEITTPGRRANLVLCTKCSRQQQITFRPSLAHKFSSTIGFLDVEGCTPFDLVLMDCEFSVGCINCPKELSFNELHPGQTKTTWCGKCHQKMEILIESTKFQKHVPSQVTDSDNAHVIELKSTRKAPKDPAIQEGKPLPENGACKHYKKSFRWLRFPCCGKTYPCDECHDDSEPDHEMKYAIRMICGFCCKEQAFTTDKPCISCGNMTTKGRSSHWEGGKGCRDKTKMSKNDKQKFSDSNSKTISKKAQREKEEAQKKGKPKK